MARLAMHRCTTQYPVQPLVDFPDSDGVCSCCQQ